MFLRPDGRLYFAGDHVSYLTGWMAGALESAQQVATRSTPGQPRAQRRRVRSQDADGVGTGEPMAARRSSPGRSPALVTALLALASPVAFAQQTPAGPPASGPPAEVNFYGNPTAAISSGVVIPAGRASVWISGTTPPVIKADAPAGSPERFWGHQDASAAGILKTIETQLADRGLTMKATSSTFGPTWCRTRRRRRRLISPAGTPPTPRSSARPRIPRKTARSTVGVLALVNADWLIEIEAFAVYPIEAIGTGDKGPRRTGLGQWGSPVASSQLARSHDAERTVRLEPSTLNLEP